MSMTATPLRVGLLGLGTVGAGTWHVLLRNAATIEARCGRRITVTRVAARNVQRAQALVAGQAMVCSDPMALVRCEEVDVVVEAIGGTSVAKELVLASIHHGKHVVTANKALLAEHGPQIFAAAAQRGVIVAYEGAVAVSIPIIKALREGLAANQIEWLAGIVNGTSNFIVSAMQQNGLGFAEALQQAQSLGYAEADPGLDVNGMDAAHKLCLLAANAFGTPVHLKDMHIEGITALDAADLHYAKHLGLCIRLLAIARRSARGPSLRVQPVALPHDHLLAQVHGAMNGILVKGDASGLTFHYGAGAGSEQTASAVIADLMDVARGMQTSPAARVPYLGFHTRPPVSHPNLAWPQPRTGYYLRIQTPDPKSTLSYVADTLAQAGVVIRQHAVFNPSPKHPPAPDGSALAILTGPLPFDQPLPWTQADKPWDARALPVQTFPCETLS